MNRDWAKFEQPETRAIRDELLKLDDKCRLVLFLEFHSTFQNIFYTHADNPDAQQRDTLLVDAAEAPAAAEAAGE